MSCSLFPPNTPLRTKIGVVVTAVYLLGLISLIYWKWTNLIGMELNNLGDFAAGAFGPLAFLWLVIGYMQQGDELKQNTDALRLQAEELANTVEQQKALVALGQEQLQTEKDLKQEELTARRKAARPKLTFSIRNFEIEPNGWSTWEVAVHNEGPVCSNMQVIEITGNVYFYVTQVIPKAQVWHLRARCLTSENFESFDFYLAYLDVSGCIEQQRVTLVSLAEGRSYTVFGEDEALIRQKKMKAKNI